MDTFLPVFYYPEPTRNPRMGHPREVTSSEAVISCSKRITLARRHLEHVIACCSFVFLEKGVCT